MIYPQRYCKKCHRIVKHILFNDTVAVCLRHDRELALALLLPHEERAYLELSQEDA